MTPQNSEQKVNWTAIVVAGTVIGGGVLLYGILAMLGRESEADRELAQKLLLEWRAQFEVVKPMVESIYVDSRVPTEQELAVLSSLLAQMEIKEVTIQHLSRSTWVEFGEMVDTLGSLFWQVPLGVVSTIFGVKIGGYVINKLIKEWKNRRRPPPSFRCPLNGCGAEFSTESELEQHVRNEHPAYATYAIEAQTEFSKLNPWVQNAVAVETFYGRLYTTNWSLYSSADLSTLTWGLISAMVYGIGMYVELYGVTSLLLLVLPP